MVEVRRKPNKPRARRGSRTTSACCRPSRVILVEGGYQDYEDDKKKRLGAEALQPRRIRYKPLVRG